MADLKRVSRNPASFEGDEFSFEEHSSQGFPGIHSLERYFDLARNNKALIAAVLALALAIGLVATLLATPQYRATTRIEISQVEQNVTDVEGLQDETVLSDRVYLPTQYELLESRSLATRIVRELDLTNDEAFIEAFGIEQGLVGNNAEALARILLANVEITPILNSSLVDISFSSPSPSVSARIANAWAEAYIAENLDRRFGATIEARDFLEERLQQTRARLEAAERELIDYASNQQLISTTQSSGEGDSATTVSQTLVASELGAFNEALSEAITDRIAAEAALAARRNAPSTGASSDSQVGVLRARRSELQVQLAELLSRFGEEYPAVETVRAQLAQIEQAIGEEQGNSLADLQAQYREALAREQSLRERVAALRGEFLAQRQDSVQYNILQREVDTNRELYAGLLQRYREIGVAGVGESNIIVVDEAEVPAAPYAPSLTRNLIVSFLIGLVIVAAGLFLYELLHQSLRDPRQVNTRLGLPLLASIPRTREEDLVEDLSHAFSELYESYFSLTSSLAFSAGGQVPQSAMITSSRAGEGKSLTSVALAYLLARQDKRVLLLDCDLRRSGVSKYLDAKKSTGVSQYLSGDDDWRSMVYSDDTLEGFDVINSGRRTHSVAELLANGRLRRLLDEVEQVYDHVIIDGPPVLGLADAPMIASSVAGVVFVVEANEGKWRYIEGALSRLQEANAEIFGVTVTKLDSRNQLYGYGQGYGYGYGYGPADQEAKA